MGKIPASGVRIGNLMNEILWNRHSAEIKLIGEWDFSHKRAYYRNKQGEQIWVDAF